MKKQSTWEGFKKDWNDNIPILAPLPLFFILLYASIISLIIFLLSLIIRGLEKLLPVWPGVEH
jgi:hypothetical protein